MPGRIPRKQTRAVANSTKAIKTTCMAIAEAEQRQHGLNLETTFPEGRIHIVIGEITVAVGRPKTKKKNH